MTTLGHLPHHGRWSVLALLLAVVGANVPRADSEERPLKAAAVIESPLASPPKAVTPEYQVKAAFLHKFTTLTTWPKEAFPAEDKKAPVIVEVVGTDPFAGQLGKTFKGKKWDDRPFVVRHSLQVPAEITAHVVFVGGLSDKDRKLLLERSHGRPVLLVGETPGLAAVGAVVNMYLEKGKVRFEINPDVAMASQLKISSQLLKLAKIVRTEKGEAKR